ncbi:heat-inducible transcription repressor HrcA [Chlorobaculum limnaeum]|uniref:Heat-inducible transcription repressor HrcA n=1 Tax=Chlorobaculum limnaeum TaxID=274537 RepID=A0A1D8D1E1_CHLLM|nr:heat-inducible transcriptional repressor HrcA [Chlorobaculum limnaeum]AOS83245.1 heat-inducible transcription repressor HrcA [Chlorobaculum limnaeum]
MIYRDLSLRERQVLGIIIQSYVVSAVPVGSRTIARNYNLGLSDATIRNVMADLEADGFISQPHTSAGRVPTDKGYRYYVDLIMNVSRIDEDEKRLIDDRFSARGSELKGTSAEVLGAAARVLGSISRQLAVVLPPRLSNAVFERLDIVQLGSARIMVVIAIQSLFVKTIVMELSAEISRRKIDAVVGVLNERLSGLTLEEIRSTIGKRLSDFKGGEALMDSIVSSADTLFDESSILERLYVSGTGNIVDQPEFKQPERVRDIITMIEDKFGMARLVDNAAPTPLREGREREVVISIGTENRTDNAADLTIVSSPYYAGKMIGRVGVMGPKRMDYEHAVRVVNYMAGCLSEALSGNN